MNLTAKEQYLKQIEDSIEECQKDALKLEALARLQSNKDYQLLIGTGYFKDEAARAVEQRAEPEMQGKEKVVDDVIVGIGQFHQYIKLIQMRGHKANADIARYKVAQEEAESAPDDEFEEIE